MHPTHPQTYVCIILARAHASATVCTHVNDSHVHRPTLTPGINTLQPWHHPPPPPAVDLEDGELIERLYVMFHGTAEDTSVPEQVGVEGQGVVCVGGACGGLGGEGGCSLAWKARRGRYCWAVCVLRLGFLVDVAGLVRQRPLCVLWVPLPRHRRPVGCPPTRGGTLVGPGAGAAHCCQRGPQIAPAGPLCQERSGSQLLPLHADGKLVAGRGATAAPLAATVSERHTQYAQPTQQPAQQLSFPRPLRTLCRPSPGAFTERPPRPGCGSWAWSWPCGCSATRSRASWRPLRPLSWTAASRCWTTVGGGQGGVRAGECILWMHFQLCTSGPWWVLGGGLHGVGAFSRTLLHCGGR